MTPSMPVELSLLTVPRDSLIDVAAEIFNVERDLRSLQGRTSGKGSDECGRICVRLGMVLIKLHDLRVPVPTMPQEPA